MSFYQERDERGVRKRFTDSNEQIFKDLHRSFGPRSLATDIDLIDYRYKRNGAGIRYVSVWELKEAVHDGPNTPEEIKQRIEEYYLKPTQVTMIRDVAQRLETAARLLIYTKDSTWFAVHVIGAPKHTFTAYTRDTLQTFIDEL